MHIAGAGETRDPDINAGTDQRRVVAGVAQPMLDTRRNKMVGPLAHRSALVGDRRHSLTRQDVADFLAMIVAMLLMTWPGCW